LVCRALALSLYHRHLTPSPRAAEAWECVFETLNSVVS